MTSSLEGEGGGLDTPQKWWRHLVMTWWQGGGGGVWIPPKSDDVIYEQPLTPGANDLDMRATWTLIVHWNCYSHFIIIVAVKNVTWPRSLLNELPVLWELIAKLSELSRINEIQVCVSDWSWSFLLPIASLLVWRIDQFVISYLSHIVFVVKRILYSYRWNLYDLLLISSLRYVRNWSI